MWWSLPLTVETSSIFRRTSTRSIYRFRALLLPRIVVVKNSHNNNNNNNDGDDDDVISIVRCCSCYHENRLASVRCCRVLIIQSTVLLDFVLRRCSTFSVPIDRFMRNRTMSVTRFSQRLRDRGREPNRPSRTYPSGNVPVDGRVRLDMLNMCRVCMSNDVSLVDVFVMNCLTDYVYQCYNVKITTNDEKSKMLCLSCFEFVIKWQQQRENIQKKQCLQTMLFKMLKERAAADPDIYLVHPNRFVIITKEKRTQQGHI